MPEVAAPDVDRIVLSPRSRGRARARMLTFLGFGVLAACVGWGMVLLVSMEDRPLTIPDADRFAWDFALFPALVAGFGILFVLSDAETYILDRNEIVHHDRFGRVERMAWSEVERVQWVDHATIFEGRGQRLAFKARFPKSRDFRQARAWIAAGPLADFDLSTPPTETWAERVLRDPSRRWRAVPWIVVCVALPLIPAALRVSRPGVALAVGAWFFASAIALFVSIVPDILRWNRAMRRVHPAYLWRLRRPGATLAANGLSGPASELSRSNAQDCAGPDVE